MSTRTWAREVRPASQVIRVESQVCSTTRTADNCSGVGFSRPPIASRMIAVVCRETWSTSGETLRSAKVRARAIASASRGSRCNAPKARIRVCATRSAAVSPVGGLLRRVPCSRSSWSCMVATSRCTLDGKYRYSVPRATCDDSATSRICTASKPPRQASWAVACRMRRRRSRCRSVRGGAVERCAGPGAVAVGLSTLVTCFPGSRVRISPSPARPCAVPWRESPDPLGTGSLPAGRFGASDDQVCNLF